MKCEVSWQLMLHFDAVATISKQSIERVALEALSVSFPDVVFGELILQKANLTIYKSCSVFNSSSRQSDRKKAECFDSISPNVCALENFLKKLFYLRSSCGSKFRTTLILRM